MSDVIRCPSCSSYVDATFVIDACPKCGHALTADEAKVAEAERLGTTKPPVDPFESLVLRVAGVLMLVESLVVLIANAKLAKSGINASNYPLIGDIVIGIGLLREKGFWTWTRESVRVWGIVKCFATPLIIGYFYIVVAQPKQILPMMPIVFLSAGMLTLLFGTFYSRARLILGACLAVMGIILDLVFSLV